MYSPPHGKLKPGCCITQPRAQFCKHFGVFARNLYNLVTHHGERKFGDIFHRSMFSVMLLRCLKRHGYFGPDRADVTPAGDDLSDDEGGGDFGFSVLGKVPE